MPLRNVVLLAWLCIALTACTQAGIDSRSPVDRQATQDNQPSTDKPAPVAVPAQSSDASAVPGFEFVVLGDTA
ncbi:hypothetical protein E4634_11910 [Mangrovimicrobium sediminis]|uniref:Uncharacterized protein n=1 Tax=Mangrovimicrobium sediminis TaxID=2562682 RepID=A0A4Z0M114_9GAMM|nr:hypothetical protein [Haliea sp. SAOS-164]TGD72985.1 hypothetical protein E4634_11910 [Haliea sp. SAOS-164]